MGEAAAGKAEATAERAGAPAATALGADAAEREERLGASTGDSVVSGEIEEDVPGPGSAPRGIAETPASPTVMRATCA